MASISSRTILVIFSSERWREKQVAVDARRKLADVAGAQQQLVADDFGFGGASRSVGMKSLLQSMVGKLRV